MGAPDAKTPEPEEVDAGWDDPEDQDELDSGWGEPTADEVAASRALTPEEREARAARDAARKERLRAKAAEKAERRKTRAAAAAAKQKKSAPRVAGAPSETEVDRRPPRRIEKKKAAVEPSEPDAEDTESEAEAAPVQRAAPLPRDWRPLVVLVVLLVVAGGVALFLWKR